MTIRVLSLVLLFTLGACGASQSESPPPSTRIEAKPNESNDMPSAVDRACVTDADCVPSACCHASECVAISAAPVCSDVMCTRECRPSTLDCGGTCMCVDGQCATKLPEPNTLTPDGQLPRE